MKSARSENGPSTDKKRFYSIVARVFAATLNGGGLRPSTSPHDTEPAIVDATHAKKAGSKSAERRAAPSGASEERAPDQELLGSVDDLANTLVSSHEDCSIQLQDIDARLRKQEISPESAQRERALVLKLHRARVARVKGVLDGYLQRAKALAMIREEFKFHFAPWYEKFGWWLLTCAISIMKTAVSFVLVGWIWYSLLYVFAYLKARLQRMRQRHFQPFT